MQSNAWRESPWACFSVRMGATKGTGFWREKAAAGHFVQGGGISTAQGRDILDEQYVIYPESLYYLLM